MNIMEDIFETDLKLYRNFVEWHQNRHHWSVYAPQLIKIDGWMVGWGLTAFW